MDKENSRNTILFVVIALALVMLYQIFYLGPQEAKRRHDSLAKSAAVAAKVQTPDLAAPGAPVLVSRAQAVAQSPRVAIATPALKGSLSLRGGRIDDLYITGHKETLDPKSGPVELFRPEGAKQAYFADFGWTGAPNTPGGAPSGTTVWTKVGGDTLTPATPVTLRYDNGQGLVFTRTISVDDKYMFTVADAAANTGAAPVQLAPYASVQRQGQPLPTVGIFEGAIGSLGGVLDLVSFKDMKDKGGRTGQTTGGWLGLTDKYWMAALAPAANAPVKTAYRITSVGGVDVFEANYVGAVRTLAPGQATTETRRLFAGAKSAPILDGYQKALGLPHFVDAIDWGRLWFLTRPIYVLLSFFQGWTGSVGVAILLLTIVRVVMTFPLYNKSFASAAEMKKLQPEVEVLRGKFKEDPAKLQQATMALYKERQVNPLAGCVPALIPIPIFFALSKVFTIAIELRHARFLGVPDLSAPDPTSFVNLFGLIPWNVAATPALGSFLDGPLHIGLIAILYGFTQWLLQAMNPQTAGIDPTQRQIFAFMPIIITFFMAHVAAGLLIYWVWSTCLTIIQQYVIMHRHGTENPIDTFLARVRGGGAKPASA